jgi:hypothetical protein
MKILYSLFASINGFTPLKLSQKIVIIAIVSKKRHDRHCPPIVMIAKIEHNSTLPRPKMHPSIFKRVTYIHEVPHCVSYSRA